MDIPVGYLLFIENHTHHLIRWEVEHNSDCFCRTCSSLLNSDSFQKAPNIEVWKINLMFKKGNFRVPRFLGTAEILFVLTQTFPGILRTCPFWDGCKHVTPSRVVNVTSNNRGLKGHGLNHLVGASYLYFNLSNFGKKHMETV